VKKRIIVEPTLCTGCEMCTHACSVIKTGAPDPLFARIHVVRDEARNICIPVVCHHCEPAPCVEACPAGAFKRVARLDIWVIDEDKCIHCGECVRACPFGAIQFLPDGDVTKCDLCGGVPRCVECCQDRVQSGNQHVQDIKASALRFDNIVESASLKRRMQLYKEGGGIK